jgi:glucose/arabinose dehydrogenase
MRKARAFSVALIVLAMAATAYSSLTQRPVNWKGLPAPYHSESAQNRPQVIARPGDAKLQLPAGFQIEEYMSGFDRPRFMMHGPGGEILLSDSGSGQEPTGSVYVLQGQSKKKIVENLDRPYGLEMHQGWLYVAEPTSVKRYKYDAKAMTAGKGEEIIAMKDFNRGHWTRSLLFNRDHSKLYVTIGSGSNVDAGEPAMRAALHRYNPDGTGHETVATGLRNIIGLRMYPGTDDVWAAVQERDHLGDDLVPDYLVKIEEGAFYGWPYAYSGPHEDPRHKNVAPDMVKKTHYPDVLLGAHVAVLDMLFYTGKQFPAAYQGGLFLAFHGSWNRAERVGYKLVHIPFKDGKPTSGPQDFLTGWMLDPAKQEVWGRPVGLLQMPDGALLVTDDGGKKIWRISHKG